METPSNFDFLPRQAVHAVHLAATRAEEFAVGDPRASGFYSRLALETALRDFARRRNVDRAGRTVGNLIVRLDGYVYKDSKRERVSAPYFDRHIIDTFRSVSDAGKAAVHGDAFEGSAARTCLENLYRSLGHVGETSGWPPATTDFDADLLPKAPARFVVLGRREVRRLEAELEAFRKKHEALSLDRDSAHQQSAALRAEAAALRADWAAARADYADAEALWAEAVTTVDQLRAELTLAKGEIAHLRDEVERLQSVVDGSVPRADFDALKSRLDRQEAAYQQLLTSAGLTSTRAFFQKGLLDFGNLLVLAGDDERPDEQDEAAAVILERLAERHTALFNRRTDA